jgi:hypothetical protein
MLKEPKKTAQGAGNPVQGLYYNEIWNIYNEKEKIYYQKKGKSSPIKHF